jgi:hypothetical protein
VQTDMLKRPAAQVRSHILVFHIVAGAAAVPGRRDPAVLPVLYAVRLVVPPAHEGAQAPVAGVHREDLQCMNCTDGDLKMCVSIIASSDWQPITCLNTGQPQCIIM